MEKRTLMVFAHFEAARMAGFGPSGRQHPKDPNLSYITIGQLRDGGGRGQEFSHVIVSEAAQRGASMEERDALGQLRASLRIEPMIWIQL